MTLWLICSVFLATGVRQPSTDIAKGFMQPPLTLLALREGVNKKSIF